VRTCNVYSQQWVRSRGEGSASAREPQFGADHIRRLRRTRRKTQFGTERKHSRIFSENIAEQFRESFSAIPVPTPPIIRKGASGSFYDKGLEGASHHAIIPNVNTVDNLRR
jgi:hypothetical protein